MEILVVADSHLTGRNPVARLDDLVELQFKKWQQIVDIANDYAVPIIHAGDIFNIAVVANSLLTRLGEILNQLKQPLYFVWGNHDLQYHSYDMWDRTSLGVLWKNNDKVRHISEFWKTYKIWWAWWDWNSEHEIQWLGDPPKLLLSHKAIVNDKLTGKNSWIQEDQEFCSPIKDIKPKFKLIICGHWHRSFRYNYQGTRVFNPGPMIRRTVDEWLKPSVVLLNINTLMHKRIYLDTLNPEQVLSRTHIEQNVESITENVVKFVDQLKHVRKTDKKGSFMKNLFHELDQHELPSRIEKILREIVATLIEKGVINEGL